MKIENKPLIISAVLCILALTVMVFSLSVGNRQNEVTFVPPPFDPNAQTGIPEVPKELGWSELDAKVFRVSVCGVIAPNETMADIWLTNPEDNDVWLKLRILAPDGKILGETGLIKQGEYVQSIILNTVPSTGSPIILKIMAYEPETYYSAGSVSINTSVY